MDDRDRCRGCGELRPADAPGGLCPACLLKAGLVDAHDLTVTLGPVSPGVLTTLAASLGGIPHVLLRDTDPGTEPGPLIQPGSSEMPAAADRSARLQLLGEIARGGMGAILKGRDPELGRDLAVKVLLEAHRDKPDLVRRFIEEAQIGGQLQHPGIVPIYELGAFADQRPYFAMKLVKGRTLSSLLADRPNPTHDLPRFLSIFESICQTMAYAHARGVIHRDLKPSNVMVGSFGEVQVMDWGLAKVLPRGGAADDASAGKVDAHDTVIATAGPDADSERSQAGSVLGTPAYMAPEQARGEVALIDERCDVFALGSILCEILTARPAFVGRSSGEIQRKAARGELSDAFALLDSIGTDADLVSLAKTCLAPEPDDRPRHAADVAERIEIHRISVQDRLHRAELARAEEAARAAEATKRARVERDRFRLAVALTASILGLLALGGGGWAYFAGQRADRRKATEAAVNKALDAAKFQWGHARSAAVGDLTAWSDALAAAQTARTLLAAGEAAPGLQDRVDQQIVELDRERDAAVRRAFEAERDRKFLERLEMNRRNQDRTRFDWQQSLDESYAVAFREFGIEMDQLDPKESGRDIAARSRGLELAFYLDDWAMLRHAISNAGGHASIGREWRKLVEVARVADPDSWRNNLRSLIGLKEPGPLDRLAAEDKTLSAQSPRSLLLLAQLLLANGRDEVAERVLKSAWRLKPDDFLICLELANSSKRERVHFSTTCVALQPTSAWVRELSAASVAEENGIMSFYSHGISQMTTTYHPLATDIEEVSLVIEPFWGVSFFYLQLDPTLQDRMLDDLRAAIRLAPDNSRYHMEVAQLLLLARFEFDEAMPEYRTAFLLEPTNAILRYNAASDLALAGELDRAVEMIEVAIQLDPNESAYPGFLGNLRERQSRPEAAFEAYRRAFALKDSKINFIGYKDMIFPMKITGKASQFVSALRERIKSDPEDRSSPIELGKALQAEARIDEAIAVYEDEIRRNPGVAAKSLYNLSVSLRKKGDAERAEETYREAVRQGASIVAGEHQHLGSILRYQGRYREALAEKRRAAEIGSTLKDWDKAASMRDVGEIEKLVILEARLPKFLAGDATPSDANECMALAEICGKKKLFHAAAGYWSDAFTHAPELAAGGRLSAACVAVAAGCGLGEDAFPPDPNARHKRLEQARDWLRSDLRRIDQSLNSFNGSKEYRNELDSWRRDPDLAPVRDPRATANLPVKEQDAWRAFWEDVATVSKKARGRRR